MTDPFSDFGDDEFQSSGSGDADHRAKRAASLPDLLLGGRVLDAPDRPPAVWGSGEHILWSQGEPMMVFAPQGRGKTTLVQQLLLQRAGVPGESSLLGLPVRPDPERLCLYCAMDRPAQAERSMRRMLHEGHRRALDERIRIWKGPLPFRLAAEPALLAAWLYQHNVGTVVLDSLKDLAVGLSDEEGGALVNAALQYLSVAGIEVVTLHHPRKGQELHRPRSLDDVYGSVWLTAGHGSVVLLWSERAGAERVQLEHLKQPARAVGPWTVHHDPATGVSMRVDASTRGAEDKLEEAYAIVVEYGPISANEARRKLGRRRVDVGADFKVLESQGRIVPGPDGWVACPDVRETPGTASRSTGDDDDGEGVSRRGTAPKGPPLGTHPEPDADMPHPGPCPDEDTSDAGDHPDARRRQATSRAEGATGASRRPAPCSYPRHRPSDWRSVHGVVCGICHPPASIELVVVDVNEGQPT